MAKSSKKAKSSAKSSKKASKSSKQAKKIAKPIKKVKAKKPAKPVKKKSSKPVKSSKSLTKKTPKVENKSAKPAKAITHKLVHKNASPNSKASPRAEGKTIVKPITAHNNAHGKKGRETMLKTRYSDKELDEFRQLILEKLEAAKNELKYLQDQISHKGDNNTGDTENTFASSDDGSNSMEREYLTQMAARQRLYIDHLDKALIRIANKTYGICRVTGKLIEKERLRAVPHATLSMEAKLMQSHPQQSQNV